MNLLFTSVGDFLTLEARTYLTEWRARSKIVERMPMQYVVPYLRFDIASTLALVDAIVCMADIDTIAFAAEEGRPGLDFALEKALVLAGDVRSLPESCSMRDGRKWNAVPFIIFCHTFGSGVMRSIDGTHICGVSGYPALSLRRIATIVDEYHDRVLQEYENLGILVRFEKGRAQVGPALKLKNEIAEGRYYYSRGDRRNNQGWVTVKRDNEGLRRDVELFEMLLDMGASETDMHRFFEEHPAILMEARLGIPISHQPNFAAQKNQKPDFAFSPILGPWKDRMIELLELKGPLEVTLTGKLHRGFTAKVTRAIDQVRDYGHYLRDPGNLETVRRAFGYVPDDSSRAVLIGRAPKGGDSEVWARRKMELDVEIITYDEILQKQADQLSRPYTLHYGTEAYPIDE